MPLKIAAKVDTVDQGYYCTKIAPLLVDDSVQFIGEVDQAGKNEFLGKACALLSASVGRPLASPEAAEPQHDCLPRQDETPSGVPQTYAIVARPDD